MRPSLGRKKGDSNPRYSYPYVSLANWWFQPLTHPSGYALNAFRGAKIEKTFYPPKNAPVFILKKMAIFGTENNPNMKFEKNKKPRIYVLGAALLLVLLASLSFGHSSLNNEDPVNFYVYPGDTQEQLLNRLKEVGKTDKVSRIAFMMKTLRYKAPYHTGHYKLEPGMSDFKLVRRLKSGIQTPVRLTFNNVRSVEQLAARLSNQLLVDSVSLLNCLKDTGWINKEGFNEYTYICAFLPDTYEVWWDARPEAIRDKLIDGYHNFWHESRVDAAKRHHLTPVEAQTLASIVEEETNKGDEMSKVAGLYLNRLSIDMPLQADPTLKYIAGDMTLRRIYKGLMTINSPYNTYKNLGLPPGPIRITSIRAIESVLNAQRHSYLYMCAKADFSGYHAFATTLNQHARNAAAYHKALNERGILE